MTTIANQTGLDRARALFEYEFGAIDADARVLYVHAPGRSEIAGNHTDHEGGHVIAGALDVSVDGIAVANGTNEIRIADDGFPTFSISLDDLAVREDELGTSEALVRGMAHEIASVGGTPSGFDFAFTCTVPSGGGLSSSAAVEAAYGRAMEALWGSDEVDPVTLAQMSQRTENNYYGKPCGLMDQAAVCLGGLAYMDFENTDRPATKKLKLNFEDHGYEFGKNRLCKVSRADFDAKIPALREQFGDRAVIRCIHYWYENDLVDRRWAALNDGDIDAFLALTRASGASSAMYLQNVTAELGKSQPAMYALGLAEHILNGRGAVRIHGGGFGGTIQAFVPVDMVDDFMARMDAWLGEGSCRHYAISESGAYAGWL